MIKDNAEELSYHISDMCKSDWYTTTDNLKRLNTVFSVYGVYFYCLGISDSGSYFTVDFYTEDCPDSLKILTPAKVSINGGSEKLDIMKKCVSYKPDKQRRIPADFLSLCRIYDIDISSIALLERIEIYKPEYTKVEELSITFLCEKDFDCAEDDNVKNSDRIDNKLLKNIEAKSKNSAVTLLSNEFTCGIQFIKCRLI